jgi:hypothetical protein
MDLLTIANIIASTYLLLVENYLKIGALIYVPSLVSNVEMLLRDIREHFESYQNFYLIFIFYFSFHLIVSFIFCNNSMAAAI